MLAIESLYQHLGRMDDPSVDRALAAALPTADPADRSRIACLLLDRRHLEGQLGLVLHFNLFEPALQDQIAGQAQTLVRAIRQVAAMAQTQGPSHVIQLIRRGQTAPLAYLVTEQLRRGEPRLAKQAAECLTYLARQAETARHNGMPAQIEPGPANQLLAAVEEAVVHFAAHHQAQTLSALCSLLPRPAHKAAAALANPEHAATGPMRSLIAQADQPMVRRSLLWAGSIATLTEPALAGMRQCAARGQLGEVLELSHLLALPAIRRTLVRLREADELWPSDDQMRQMTADQLRLLPGWAMALNFDDTQRIAKLAGLSRVVDPPTRLAALRRLLSLVKTLPPGAVDDAIARFATDSDSPVASLAVWHLLHRHYRKLPRMLAKLVNSPHPRVRRIAARRLAPIGFERLWDHWPQLTHQQRRSAGKALIKIDPGFHRLLGERLSKPLRDMRLRALSMIDELNQGSFFTTALIQLLRDEDDYIVSAAVSALGGADGPEVVEALRRALEHRDARVRANAVEALERMQTSDHVHQLVRIASEDANRPRANAIGALMAMRTDEALTSLHTMLEDQRAEHRRSALWLVEHLKLIDVVRQVAEISISDPDDTTRQRADLVVHELMDAMQGDLLPSTV